MAEKGAHLTGTAFQKPSIFEIIAQESLAFTLEPAFKKFLSFVISLNYERYGHLLRWSDEGYAIFNIILQRYYLNKYSASFSETFYGLKRISLNDSQSKTKMTNRQKGLSLLSLVLFPYTREKINKIVQQYKLDEVDGNIPQKRWQQYFRKGIIKSHTIIFVMYEFLILYTYVLYISGRSPYPTPMLKLLSVTLTYASTQPLIPIADLLRKIKSNSFGINDGCYILERLVTRSIEVGAFILQFMSWRSQENYYSDIMALPIPPPPKVTEPAERYKGICPVCYKVPYIHTVLIVSGYVFCYQCIVYEVRKNKKCPVTYYPATEDDLVRLYIEG